MNHHRNSPEALNRAQCLELLRSTGLGRIAYSQRALPAIITVSYAVMGETIVLRVDAGSPELASLRDAVVAFQADHSGLDNQRGWSVNCVGKARPVTDPVEVSRLEAATAGGPGSRQPTFLRLEPELLEGRLFYQLPLAPTTGLRAAVAPAS